jgi:hypothetical protein
MGSEMLEAIALVNALRIILNATATTYMFKNNYTNKYS